MKVIKVRVTADAKKELIVSAGADEYHISVRVSAVRNEANTRARELIADLYEVPVELVRILTGHRSPTKRFEIVNR